MIKVLFVCLGNICRSPMAEFLFKDLTNRKNISNKFIIESRATSSEEIGNPVHYGTKEKLQEYGIDTTGKYAEKLTMEDYEKFDYIIGMDNQNIIDMKYIFNGDKEHKIYKLLDFSQNSRNIADPWYTHNFDKTYEDIMEGLNSFLNYLIDNRII